MAKLSRAARPGRPETKIGILTRLLNRKRGASIAEISKATDWQAHTIRAAVSRLRKSGSKIERIKEDGSDSRYRRIREGSNE